jgi:CTP synthase (UTP-ammonia lyase)
VIEYARNVLGIRNAAHQEVEPQAENPFIQSLSCSLRGRTMHVHLYSDSNAYRYYGESDVEEQYYCSMGLTRENQKLLDDGGFRVVGTDADGDARIVELPDHRFFLATLFVPQRNLNADQTHPLILAFVRACATKTQPPRRSVAQ